MGVLQIEDSCTGEFYSKEVGQPERKIGVVTMKGMRAIQ
tara:strand:- start:2872 stop:2988 length:117 start_codon:yes stop_codon:yes gene_type:complete